MTLASFILILILSSVSALHPSLNSSNVGHGTTKWSIGDFLSAGNIAWIVVVALACFVGILYTCFWCHTKREDDRAPAPQNDIEVLDFDIACHMFTLHELEEATNSFNEGNILGKGGYGVVYRGQFDDGTLIAVKRMNSPGSKGTEQFLAEVQVLSKVKHNNVVELLGCCIDGDERFLVYEYVGKGSLSQNLFQWRERRPAPLTWVQRLCIAYDMARGLEYLHSSVLKNGYSFIHRDIKSANILLDDYTRAKVADFGLARSANTDLTIYTDVGGGTRGYMAYEYAMHGRYTTKVDVYAFGVILMELITGLKAMDNDKLSEEASLAWLCKNNVDTLIKMIDQTILERDAEASIHKVAELAVDCTQHDPKKRPTMGDAVLVLGNLVHAKEPLPPGGEEEEEAIINDFWVSQNMAEVFPDWKDMKGALTKNPDVCSSSSINIEFTLKD